MVVVVVMVEEDENKAELILVDKGLIVVKERVEEIKELFTDEIEEVTEIVVEGCVSTIVVGTELVLVEGCCKETDNVVVETLEIELMEVDAENSVEVLTLLTWIGVVVNKGILSGVWDEDVVGFMPVVLDDMGVDELNEDDFVVIAVLVMGVGGNVVVEDDEYEAAFVKLKGGVVETDVIVVVVVMVVVVTTPICVTFAVLLLVDAVVVLFGEVVVEFKMTN